LLLVGEPLTGLPATLVTDSVVSIAAGLVLDPDFARDDRRLFGGRVVFIGSSHSDTRDFRLTPSGVRPGVELLANAVRFAALQAPWDHDSDWHYKAVVLFAFVLLAATGWFFNKPLGLLLQVVVGLISLVIAANSFGYYLYFDALEDAIALALLFSALEALLSIRGTLCRAFRQKGICLCRKLCHALIRKPLWGKEGRPTP
jgi:CHASE2 domain-containing sensor protein